MTVPADHHPAAAHVGHRDVTGGWLRPAVFGITDGLVSNTSLLAGVAGAGLSPHAIVLTGVAGLIGGAFSMATGEFVSVASQRELTHAEIEIEKAELKRVPSAELAELAAVYVSRGVEPGLAHEVARQISVDPEQALRVHAMEELGVDPDALPSPWTAASSSFVAFVLGALVPLLPYLLGADTFVASVALAAASLFAAGVAVSRFTNRSALYAGLRQLLLGAAAAGVTFLVGTAVGS
ncbi:MAG: rane protein [Frankiales bacterium]|nr:rane protein [Frankiales bacterium]